jgi:hypothetical protein
MKDNTGESRTLDIDYTLIEKDNLDFKNAGCNKVCKGTDSAETVFPRSHDHVEHLDDDLIDSIHLARKRVKTRKRRQIVEKRTEPELSLDTTTANKMSEDCFQSETRRDFPSIMTEEFEPNRCKAV